MKLLVGFKILDLPLDREFLPMEDLTLHLRNGEEPCNLVGRVLATVGLFYDVSRGQIAKDSCCAKGIMLVRTNFLNG
jgi:hypothetical protein